MARVSLRNICKSYSNGVQVVKNVNLEIADKEFMVWRFRLQVDNVAHGGGA
jgi:multiple sugar transport system ATP-binding protein